MERATISFAGTALAENEHGVRTVGGLRDDAIELLHLRGTADDSTVALLGLELLAQHAVFGFQLEVVGDTLQQKLKFVDAKGFRDVVVRTILHGLHRRLHGAVAGDDDHESFGTLGLDLAKSLQAPSSG